MIKVEHLNKSYGTLQVLRDINLCISQGEVVSIVGASGAGKECGFCVPIPQPIARVHGAGECVPARTDRRAKHERSNRGGNAAAEFPEGGRPGRT